MYLLPWPLCDLCCCDNTHVRSQYWPAFHFHTYCRARKTPEGKRFGTTMISVGAAATAYHAAHGDLRCALRKLDCELLTCLSPPCYLMSMRKLPDFCTQPQLARTSSWACIGDPRPHHGLSMLRTKPDLLEHKGGLHCAASRIERILVLLMPSEPSQVLSQTGQ